jgi:Common central domain of tyrosinase
MFDAFSSIPVRLALLGPLLLLRIYPANGQSLEIVTDRDQVLVGTQTVNVGEHIRLRVRTNPASISFSNPQWIVTGLHLADWVTKDAEPILVSLQEYLKDHIHFLWKDTTSPGQPNVVYVTVQTIDGVLSQQVSFNVTRQPKPEKFYSDDFLMENHNNWHSVYMFWNAATRRGDLFLTWHSSQLEYYEKWREFFGYPPIPDWDPTMPWTTAPEPPSKQHPAGVPGPSEAPSMPHDLVTLDLTDQGLATSGEGEYDLVTDQQSRGRRQQFVDAGYVLRTETVRELLCEDPNFPCASPAFSKNGVADLPSWWRPDSGQPGADPWFQAGCPARATPDPLAPVVPTCAPQTKTSLEDYSLRELGESMESGWYATNFLVNYHALGHIVASEDMSNPVTSMRDPIFWGWHKHLDGILSEWKITLGEQNAEALGDVQIYTTPAFLDNWTKLRVAFSRRVVPEFVRPSHVVVDGSPATSVADVSLTGSGYIFEFSGFAVPPDGTFEVVIRREVDNTIRTSAADPRPASALIISTYGGLLQPAVNRLSYEKP